MVYSQVARESSRPKSCRPKPKSCCPKFLVMSPEMKVKSPDETNTKNVMLPEILIMSPEKKSQVARRNKYLKIRISDC